MQYSAPPDEPFATLAEAAFNRNVISQNPTRRLTGSKATYQCNAGYAEGTGDAVKTCNMGQWGSAPALVCTIAYCVAPTIQFAVTVVTKVPPYASGCSLYVVVSLCI